MLSSCSGSKQDLRSVNMRPAILNCRSMPALVDGIECICLAKIDKCGNSSIFDFQNVRTSEEHCFFFF